MKPPLKPVIALAAVFALIGTPVLLAGYLAGAAQKDPIATLAGAFDVLRLPGNARQYTQWIAKAGTQCNEVTPEMVSGIITVESNWDPRAGNGDAQGIGQFLSSTWESHAVDADGNGSKDVHGAADGIVSVGAYLCHLSKEVRGHLDRNEITGLQGEGNLRDLTIVAYNKGPNIWLLDKWNDIPINFDSDGIPDAKDGNGLTGRQYLDKVNAAINGFRTPGTGGAVHPQAREAMRQAALGEVGTPEVPMGSNCQKYSDRCVAWCAIFASWIWNKGGYKFSDPWVRNFYNFGVENRTYQTDFRRALPGDLLIYYDAEQRSENPYVHIGVIINARSDGMIETVEGNSGNKVTMHSWFNPKSRGAIGFVAPVPGK